MAEKSDNHSKDNDWFVQQCRRVGIKATRQRQEIFAVLIRTEEHPDAETVYQEVSRSIPSVSLDTVYRNLKTLEEHGIIQRVGAMGYRTRFDANMKPHHHFVCTKCGLIRDFYDDEFDAYSPPAQVKNFGTPQSFQIELRGVCKSCAKKK